MRPGHVWTGPLIFEPRPTVQPQLPRRAELTVPVAPTATPADTDVFESPDGSKRYVLPRYALAFDKVGLADEPRIAIADRNGTPTLVVTLIETPSPAAIAGTVELPHRLSVTLMYSLPVAGGGHQVTKDAFTSVLLDDAQTTVTAELPLTEPGQRQRLVAVLSSLDYGATLIVGRTIDSVGVPTATKLPDGATGYVVGPLLLEWTVPPAPIVLSQAHSDRLGGSGAGIRPVERRGIKFGDRTHWYWQDPARPKSFSFLPDRFVLARAADRNRQPLLHVYAVAPAGDGEPLFAFAFVARPVVDTARLEAARPKLEQFARDLGASDPIAIELEIVPDPQPVLRLALPQNGAPSFAMTERPAANIDLEAGLAHAETMGLADFHLVYQALFGASLTLLSGEVRVATGGDPEHVDVPLELRIDKTIGDVLAVSAGAPSSEGLGYRLVNVIESPVRIDGLLKATAEVGDKLVRLRTIVAGQRLAPGQGIDVVLEAEEPIAPPERDAIVFDQSAVVVEADATAVWDVVFDRNAPTPSWPVTVEAFAPMFTSPTDRVIAFVVNVEHGGSVSVTVDKLSATTRVHVPIEPLIKGAPMPPIRYRTQTVWDVGGNVFSPLSEVTGTLLVPVRTAPASPA